MSDIKTVTINMPFGDYPFDLYSCEIISESHSEKSLVVECKEVENKISVLIKEREELLDKAIRFDLDRAGIENREKESIELVELRAQVARYFKHEEKK
jgi:hypothetical protein